jgi:hypothetical protein
MECADLQLGQRLPGLASGRPEHGQTVFQFQFGEIMATPFDVHQSHTQNLQNFHILLKNSISSVTTRLTGKDGMAMYMFMLQRVDFDRRTSKEAFNRRLSMLPHNMAMLKKTLPVNDCFDQVVEKIEEGKGIKSILKLRVKEPQKGNGVGGKLVVIPKDVHVDDGCDFSDHQNDSPSQIKKRYPPLLGIPQVCSSDVWILYKEMENGLLSHVDLRRNKDVVQQSNIHKQTSPGEWVYAMRAGSRSAAAKKYFRAPSILNKMAPEAIQNAVNFSLLKITTSINPMNMM